MKGKITIWRFVGVLSLLVVAFGFICVFNGCEFVKSQMDAYCEIEEMLPDTLKINLPPRQLANTDSVSMENVFNYVKNSDKMVRDIYKSNAQSSAGTNQLRLFIKNPWQRAYWEIWFCVGVCFVFLFLLRFIVKYSWFKPLLFLLFVATAVVLAMLNLSSGLKTATINDIDTFFISVFFFSIGLFLIAFLNMLILLMSKKIASDIRIVREEHRRKTLLWAAVVGWALAYSIFFVGMYASGTQKSALTAIIRPAFSASKMFFMADSPSDFAAGLRQNGAFMGFYSLVKIYVLAITTIMLLSLVFNRWKTYFETKMANAKNKQLFVFFGINRASVVMAKNIKKEVSEDKRVLLFVENRKENADLFKSLSFSSVLGLFRHRPEAYETIDDLGARLIISNVMMSSPECSDLLTSNKEEKVKVMMKSLGLMQFYRLAKEAQQVHCFFMYDDQNININGSYNLRKLLNKSFYKSDTTFKIHCWARQGAKTQMLEIPDEDKSVWQVNKNIMQKSLQCYKSLCDHIHIGYEKLRSEHEKEKLEQKQKRQWLYETEVDILDSSQLSVQLLMQNPECHPIRFVDVDTNTATVKDRFEALIIGFGETGQETFKFLYEFGAFMHFDCSNNYSEETARTAITVRSPFHCDVIDSNMSVLKAEFLHNAPAVANAYNMQKKRGRWKPNFDDPLVSFHQAKYNNQEFIDLIEERITKVNYIVLALGSDELNLAVLNDLMEVAVRKRENGCLGELTIFVRSYLYSNNEAMKQMASYYNNLGYGDDIVKRAKREHVIIFGEEHQLFSYKNIIRDEIVSHAKEYYRRYEELRENKKINEDIWEERHNKSKKLSWGIRKKVKRQEQQDINNSLHAKTKSCLVSNDNHPVLSKEIADAIIFEEDGKPIQFNTSKIAIKRLCTNLARTEHLRWNASHEMLGYIMNEDTGCNEMNKTHNCLVPWEMLPKVTERYNNAEDQKEPGKKRYYVDYQAYDYLVVKATFEMSVK